jgi:hypothetical protein
VEPIAIKRRDGVILYETSAPDLRAAVERVVVEGGSLQGVDFSWLRLNGADLHGADLRGAKLSGTHLEGADLREADLREADLRWCCLSGADLRGADVTGADLRGADLRGADLSFLSPQKTRLNWTSHVFIAKALLRAAGTDAEKRKVAGLVLVSHDWCWSAFLALKDPLTGWALDTLAQFVHPADTEADVPAAVWGRRIATTTQGETPCSDAT